MMSESLIGTLDPEKLTRHVDVLTLSYHATDVPVTLLRFSTDGEIVDIVFKTSYDAIPAHLMFRALGPVRIALGDQEIVIEPAAVVKLTFGRKTMRLKFRANTYLQG